MAALGDLPLTPEGDETGAGAAFRLQSASPQDAEIGLEYGWAISLSNGNPYAVARCCQELSRREALYRGHEALQRGLDRLSFAGQADLAVQDPGREHFVWFDAGEDKCLRVLTTAGFGVAISASAEVRDPDGSIRETSDRGLPPWHPSFRYFRLSQTTDHLFAAYRNQWLACELLLSDKFPLKNAEREKDWLDRVIPDLTGSMDLERYVENPEDDPAGNFIREHYVDTRLRLFHSKEGEPRLLPHEAGDRSHVEEALERLSRFYIDLCNHLLDVTRPAGAMTHEGFEAMTSTLRSGGHVIVSSDPTRLSQDPQLRDKAWEGFPRVPYKHDHELSRPGVVALLARAPLSDFDLPDSIWRFGFTAGDPGKGDEALYLATRLDAPLRIGNEFDVLEKQQNLELLNQGRPRFRFPL